MNDSTGRNADAHLPLKPVVFHILLALAEGDSHGYRIIRSVRSQSEGRIWLRTGAFYRHLKWLLDNRLAQEGAGGASEDDPRRTTYYRLTDFGREVLLAEGRRMARLISLTEALDLTPGGGAR